MSQQTQPSRGQQIKMFVSIGKQLAASYIGWTIVISLLIGLAIGWFLFGWVIAPVQWTDAKPASLSWESGYQQRYLSYSADALTAGAPISEVAKNFGEGWNKAQVIEKLSQMINEGWPNADRLTRLRDELALFSGEVGPTETVTPSGVSSALVPLLLMFLGVMTLVEINYHLSLSINPDDPLRLFGIAFNAKSPVAWGLSIALIGIGFFLFRKAGRRVSAVRRGFCWRNGGRW